MPRPNDPTHYDRTLQSTRRVDRTRQTRPDPSASQTQAPPPRRAGLPFKLPARYEFVEVLGKGGMGVVARVRDNELERDVALKAILPARASRDALARFINEARVTGQLEHPAIMPVHDAGRAEDGSFWYTMSLLSGGSLREKANEHFQRGRSFPIEERIAIIARVGEGLAYAHSKGVIHRDIKPENIMLGEFGEVLITDFGIAKVLEAGSSSDADSASIIDERELLDQPAVTLEGKIMGTPAFMPPEQARGQIAKLGPWSDVWALGAMLYYLLAGEPPYSGADVMEILHRAKEGRPIDVRAAAAENGRPKVPPALAAIVMRALHPLPNRRYRTAPAMVEDLRAYLAGDPVSVHRGGPAEQAIRWARRNPTTAAVASLLIGFVLIGGAGVSHFAGQAEVQERERQLAESRAAEQQSRAEQQQARAAQQEAARRLAEAEAREAQAAVREARVRELAQQEKFEELRQYVGAEAQRRQAATVAEVAAAVQAEAAKYGVQNITELDRSWNWDQIGRERLLGWSDRLSGAIRAAEAAGTSTDTQHLVLLATMLYGAEDYPKAAEWFSRVLEREPNNADACANYASSLYNLGRSAEALPWAKRAVATLPNDMQTWYGLADILHALERYSEAIEAYDRSFELMERYQRRLAPAALSMRLMNRGVAKMRDGRSVDAMADYDAALRVDPQNWRAWFNLGNAHARAKDNDKAVSAWRKALQTGATGAQRKAILDNFRVLGVTE